MSAYFVPYGTGGTEKLREWRMSAGGVRPDGGLNAADRAFSLTPDQSPVLKNLWFHEGSLKKRWGQRLLAHLPDEGERPLSAARCREGGAYIESTGGLWHVDTETGETTRIHTFGEAARTRTARGCFFEWRGAQHFIGAGEYLSLTGAACASAELYAPLVLRGRSPDGKTPGTEAEAWNRMTGRHRVGYTSNGTTKEFSLAFEASSGVRVWMGGNELREGSDYLFDAAAGMVTFFTAPPSGSNLVVVEADCPAKSEGDKLLSGSMATVLGGSGRLLLCVPGEKTLLYSPPETPLYVPTAYTVSVDGDAPTGFGRQYDALYLFQPQGIWRVQDGADAPVLQLISLFYGCDMPGSIATAGNRLLWASSYAGVQLLEGGAFDGDIRVQSISRNIDPLLRAEEREVLGAAVAIDFGGRYFLCAGQHVYVWDYTLRPYTSSGAAERRTRALSWFYFDGIEACAWFTNGRALFHALPDGRIAQHAACLDDFGAPIHAVYRTPMLDFGERHRFKTICGVYIGLRTDEQTRASVKYLTGGHDTAGEETEEAPIGVRSFNWARLRWDAFFFEVCSHFKVFARPMVQRRAVLFGVELANREAGSDLSVTDMTVRYRWGGIAHDF